MLAYDTFTVGGLTFLVNSGNEQDPYQQKPSNAFRLISTLTCQKIWTKTDQRCPSIFWAARVRTNIQGQIQKMKTTTHKLTHNDTHNDTQTHNYTQWHTLTYTHFLTHTFYRTLSIAHLHTRRQTHTACHRVCFIMYHCVSYCQCISFRVFLYYFAFLNARYLEHVIFIRNSLCQFVLHNDFYQL